MRAAFGAVFIDHGITKFPAAAGLSEMMGMPVAMVYMLGAIAMVHWPRWSFTSAEGFPMGGMEFQVLLTTLAAYLLVRGNDL